LKRFKLPILPDQIRSPLRSTRALALRRTTPSVTMQPAMTLVFPSLKSCRTSALPMSFSTRVGASNPSMVERISSVTS
jgi:hypothetical protein